MSKRQIQTLAALSAVVFAGAIAWYELGFDRHTYVSDVDPATLRFEPMPGQIVADQANPAWLKRHGSGPFFLCGPGDPEDFLYRGSLRADGTRDGDQMALIEKLKGTGANSIYLMAVRSHGGDGDSSQNPFIGHDPSNGLNRAVLDQWETWFAEMDREGIAIFFFLYDDSARIWNTGNRVSEAEAEFVRALVERFRHHRNLIWVIAEEYEERYSAIRVSRLAAQIRAADPFGHPVAVHKLAGLEFSEFAEDSFVDQFAIQFDAPDARSLHDNIARAWVVAAGRYNLNLAESHPVVGGAALRQRNWAAAFAGSYVMALGMNIADTPVSDLEDCGRLVGFMETTTFSSMAPHDDLAFAGTQYVLARPGNGYIAYAANGPVRIGLRGLSAGVYDLTWFDPITGTTIEQPGVEIEAGNGSWAKPTEIGAEVALYVRRRG